MKIILNSILLALILFQVVQTLDCPDGYGAYNGACEKCFDPECKSCARTGPTEEIMKCTSCISGFYLNDRTCDPCSDKGCAECSAGGPGKCSTCKSGFTLSSDGNTCQPCVDKGCGSCDDDPSTCLACAENYYMENSQCVSCGVGKSSPSGSTSVDACITCGDNFCKSCSGVAGTGKCHTCNPTYFLTPSSTCQKCDDANCLACSASGLKQCTMCAANYDGFNRECTPCPAGMTSQPGGFCQGCGGEGCKTCDPVNPEKCTRCLPGYFLEDSQCSGCGEGKYPVDSTIGGTSSSYCVDCDIAHCKICTGPGTSLGVCTRCQDGFVLDTAGSCYSCEDKGCTSCFGAGTKQCTSCQGGYYLKYNECISCGNGVSSPPGSTSYKDCGISNPSVETSSSGGSNSTVIFVVAALVGVLLGLTFAFVYNRSRFFKLKRSSSASSVGIDPQNAPQTPEIDEKKYNKIELGRLRYELEE